MPEVVSRCKSFASVLHVMCDERYNNYDDGVFINLSNCAPDTAIGFLSERRIAKQSRFTMLRNILKKATHRLERTSANDDKHTTLIHILEAERILYNLCDQICTENEGEDAVLFGYIHIFLLWLRNMYLRSEHQTYQVTLMHLAIICMYRRLSTIRSIIASSHLESKMHSDLRQPHAIDCIAFWHTIICTFEHHEQHQYIDHIMIHTIQQMVSDATL